MPYSGILLIALLIDTKMENCPIPIYYKTVPVYVSFAMCFENVELLSKFIIMTVGCIPWLRFKKIHPCLFIKTLFNIWRLLPVWVMNV